MASCMIPGFSMLLLRQDIQRTAFHRSLTLTLCVIRLDINQCTILINPAWFCNHLDIVNCMLNYECGGSRDSFCTWPNEICIYRVIQICPKCWANILAQTSLNSAQNPNIRQIKTFGHCRLLDSDKFGFFNNKSKEFTTTNFRKIPNPSTMNISHSTRNHPNAIQE